MFYSLFWFWFRVLSFSFFSCFWIFDFVRVFFWCSFCSVYVSTRFRFIFVSNLFFSIFKITFRSNNREIIDNDSSCKQCLKRLTIDFFARCDIKVKNKKCQYCVVQKTTRIKIYWLARDKIFTLIVCQILEHMKNFVRNLIKWNKRIKLDFLTYEKNCNIAMFLYNWIFDIAIAKFKKKSTILIFEIFDRMIFVFKRQNEFKKIKMNWNFNEK